MSYHTSCRKCDNPIFMSETNGKWKPFEDSTLSTLHRCSVKTPVSPTDRISALEKMVRHLIDRITLQQEEIRELRKSRT